MGREFLWLSQRTSAALKDTASSCLRRMWDANKIGLCPPPIETEKGWLVLYHGVRNTASDSIYLLGLALFDLARPDLCLKRGNSWIFGPEAPYEREGDVSDVVLFPCGQTIGEDGDTIHLYYGAADSCVAWLPEVFASSPRGSTLIPARNATKLPNSGYD